MNKFVKGILLVIGVFLTAIEAGNVVWPVTITTAVVVGVGYAVKNIWLPSVSADGKFDWQDIASAVILAVTVAIGDSIATLVTNGVMDWLLLGKTILSVVITYFTATYFAPETKK